MAAPNHYDSVIDTMSASAKTVMTRGKSNDMLSVKTQNLSAIKSFHIDSNGENKARLLQLNVYATTVVSKRHGLITQQQRD